MVREMAIPQRLLAVGLGRARGFISVCALLACAAACSSSKATISPTTSTRSLTAPPIATTTTTSTGRVVTSTVTYAFGDIRLDPAGGAKPTITARAALNASSHASRTPIPGVSPQVLLGLLTVSGGASVTPYPQNRSIEHRLAWLVVSRSREVVANCPAGAQCPPTAGTGIDAVDARTGMNLGGWWWAGDNAAP